MCYDWGVTRKEDNNMASGDMARRIKELRKERNMTLEDVAKIVGVGKSTVRKWETGMIENMRRDKIAALAKALGTTPVALMGWVDEEVEKKNDFIAEAVIRMRTDETFASVVENLYKLDQDKLETINQMLNTLFK
jgi:transcriptional regulator with XRE-family HTH domain